jgi:hypothetical protein
MARDNSIWVAASVFVAAVAGSLLGRKPPPTPDPAVEPRPARLVSAAAHATAFLAAVLGEARLEPSDALEVLLLGLATVGGVMALIGPSPKLGRDILRLARTVLLGWLLGVLSRDMD